MTVCILTKTEVNDSKGVFDTIVIGVYDSLEKAQEWMNHEIEEAREEFSSVDFEEYKYEVENDNCTHWGIWEKGQYMSNHLELEIHPQKIS